MAKFDLEKYWYFRVWVKSQIAQLRALLSEYQQNGGGGGTGGGGDFDPNGSYPNMSVGTATKATSATTADRATKATTADKAATADYATRADTAQKAAIADSALFADSAITADKATTADYATAAGQATTAESAKTATNADRATTAGHAITADVAESAEHAATASLATRATVADSADSATHADSADSATIANSAMKAEYATNAGNAERATIANSAESAKSAASASTAALAINLQNAPELTTSNEQIVVKVGDKTSNALTVPYAQRADFATDLSGRVEATPEVFTYRPSAGDKSIKDDNAFIRRIKGNSIIMNQIVPDVMTIQDGTGSLADHTYTITPTGSYPGIKGSFNKLIPDEHKLFISMGLRIEGVTKPRLGVNIQGGFNTSLYYTQNSTGLTTFEQIITITGATNYNIVFFADASATIITIASPQIIDLTAMFGTGNEPTTVEEFRALYSDSYYPYNAGELRNLVCSGIKTVGFNQWDGTTQVGYINDKTGIVTSNSSYLCTDFIRVIPNQEYYINTEQTNGRWGAWYDANKNYVAGILNYDQVYVAPLTAAYVRLTIKTADSGNPDTFCINLHHTGYRDGEYAPYKEVTHALPLSKITNGEPLRKAGSVYDEINETEYIKRVGVVDLGSLEWMAYGTVENVFWSATVLQDATLFGFSGIPNLTCAIDVLPFNQMNTGTENISISLHDAQKRVIICAPNFETTEAGIAALKASLSGVLLHYELAEPIVTPIETPIDFNYYVEDFGTEEAILAENSAPFSADIVYQFNAVDNIRQNRISIQKLNDIFSGSKGEYVRADGSWGYIADLKGNFFVKPTLKRIRTGISELSDTIQIIHPYLTEHVGDAKIVLMAVKRRGGTYYNSATNAKSRRKKRKAWGELHRAAMPETEIDHNTIEMPNSASFETWQNVILSACGRIPVGLDNAREPYNVNVASEDLADFFATNGAIFVGKTPVIRLGVALRIPNPNFIDYGNGNKMWDYSYVTGKWEYKYLYSDVAEIVVKSQMLRTGGYALGLELV